MFRSNQVVTLLACVLFAFGSAASAQNCGCKQPQVVKKAPDCGCKQPQVVQKAPNQCVQRQKPYVESTPSRCIAPRNLPDVYEQEAARAADAAEVLSRPPAQDLVRNAKAVAVIPGVKKAAFAFGVRWGKGLMTKRDVDGRWLPPSYIDITGGNFGFQAGIQSTDLVLIFTDERAINSLLRGKLTLNADASAAAGPYGRKASVGVPILLNAGIYAWSRSRGLFAGVSLDGSAITVDDSSNRRVYGKDISGDEILMERRVEVNTAVAPFLNAMEVYAPSLNAQAPAEPQIETQAQAGSTND
jgi:lipid-binding SYLF domain-containing protein